MVARVQLALILLLAFIAGPFKCFAATDWLLDAWRVEDGLPDNVIHAIAQTPDGYLWLGTPGGLVRFDGMRFSPVEDPALTIERVRQLYVDRAGRLWVLGEAGEIAFIHEGRVTAFDSTHGLPLSGLQTPTEDAQGQIWFSARADEGCFHFDGARFTSVLPTNSPAPGQFNYLAFDNDGTLYGAREGELWKLRPGEPKILQREDSEFVPILCPSQHGGFWLIASNECFLIRAGRRERIAEIPYLQATNSEVSARYEDAAGRLWLVTRQRPRPISITTNGVVTEHAFTSRPGLNCRTLFEDREGNRWWSTANDGLRRFRQRRLELVSDGTNLIPNIVHAVAADPRAGVWALIGRGLVRITNSEIGTIQLLTNRFPSRMSLWVDADESVWMGGSRAGLFRISGGRLDQFRNEAGIAGATTTLSTLFRDSRGDLLVGSSEGLYRFGSGKIFRVPEADAAETVRADFRAFAQDRRGRVYAGSRNAGLFRREGDHWTRLTNSLPGDDIAALWCDADESLWIGVTGHGLCRLSDAKTFSYQPTRARLPRNIYGMIEDSLGFLWLTSSEGIFRVPREQLNALADGRAADAKVRRFDKSDGMLSTQCTGGQQPVVTRSTDGKLWFATAGGLYAIDPKSVPQNNLVPPVVVEEVRIDDRIAWKRPLNSSRSVGDGFEVPPNNVRLEFRFTALSLCAPQRNHFRYQLVGLNSDWVEADTQRVAYYTRVPPGHYQFKVMACNNDDVWNEAAASIAVTVLPPWWQTLWFRSLVALSAGLLLFSIYRRRVAGLERQHASQRNFSRQLIESQEQERQRISAELHDSLGQNLLVVKNYAVMALKETTPPEKVREQIQQISTTASASIEEVRSIARALRPYQLDRFGLTKTLEDAAELLAKTGSLRIQTEIDNVDETFAPEAEISIYRVVQEWLNNVVKHARASTARMRVQKDASVVRLFLEDDGVGFDYALVMNRVGEAGVGLTNLRERVHLLEGTLKIETAPGQGTRLRVEIPCRK